MADRIRCVSKKEPGVEVEELGRTFVDLHLLENLCIVDGARASAVKGKNTALIVADDSQLKSIILLLDVVVCDRLHSVKTWLLQKGYECPINHSNAVRKNM